MRKRSSFYQICWLFPLLSATLASPPAATASDILPPGFRPLAPGTHALIGGKVIPKPGQILEDGVIIVRDGKIKEVGKGVTPPEDARIWNMRGMVIYAGFIDPYLVLGASNAPAFGGESEPVSSDL